MTERDANSRLEDDGASYMMSVSDIMSGLLFVFVITLMAFVLNFQQAQREAQAEQDSLREEQESLRALVSAYSGIEDLRERMLRELERALAAQGIQVTVEAEVGVLRLDERAIEFESGRAELSGQAGKNAAVIAEVLVDVIPCYTELDRDAAAARECSAETLGALEAVFIEGHTDNQPMMRQGVDQNWELSANRAIRAYREFAEVSPSLTELVNRDKQRIFSVAGYGYSRPLPGRDYDVPTADPQNRRIDLRFIMAPPTNDPEVIEALRGRGAE
ncbi:OmpA family protein [Aquisalimonas sp. 2447]|uniref:OmpA/MotB family protein n=1 Tax=Aquisalimonas sp. 2447 TaxID=2740807 RepID=UPI00143234A4|nr:OmpA family protein [Aquisalimonas sp. 2447]QIT55234.1 OmpA family protein [Aquisalimonas sp. 2447]